MVAEEGGITLVAPVFSLVLGDSPRTYPRENGSTDLATTLFSGLLGDLKKKKTQKGSFHLTLMAICHESNREKIPHAKFSRVDRFSGRARPRRPFGARALTPGDGEEGGIALVAPVFLSCAVRFYKDVDGRK